jgi:hypothetical protein
MVKRQRTKRQTTIYKTIHRKLKIEDNKEVIRRCKSKKDRQHNGQKTKNKKTNSDLQNNAQKTKDPVK